MGGDPALKARDELYRIVDPGFIDIVGVPEGTGRAVAPLLHGRGGVVTELTSLGVVMDGEDVKQPCAPGRLLLAELIEKPGQIVGAAVLGPVGQAAPAVQ